MIAELKTLLAAPVAGHFAPCPGHHVPRRALGWLLWAPAWLALLSGTSWAQMSPTGSVAGSGQVALKKQPEILRMRIELLAKGKDLREALAKLAQRRAAAAKQLATLGALADSIQFGDPKLASPTDQQRQIEMMVRQRLQSGRRRAREKAPVAQPVTVAVSLTAEWPLEATAAEERLIQSADLQEAIRAADLAGIKEAEELSPEEQELAEEMAEAAGEYGYSGQEAPKPGEPAFLFVSKISDEDHDKALAEAFDKAKAHAARVAKAAGAALGPLDELSATAGAGDFEDYGYEYGPSAAYQLMQQAVAATGGNPAEAIGPAPTEVVYQVHVTASFRLSAAANAKAR